MLVPTFFYTSSIQAANICIYVWYAKVYSQVLSSGRIVRFTAGSKQSMCVKATLLCRLNKQDVDNDPPLACFSCTGLIVTALMCICVSCPGCPVFVWSVVSSSMTVGRVFQACPIVWLLPSPGGWVNRRGYADCSSFHSCSFSALFKHFSPFQKFPTSSSVSSGH